MLWWSSHTKRFQGLDIFMQHASTGRKTIVGLVMQLQGRVTRIGFFLLKFCDENRGHH